MHVLLFIIYTSVLSLLISRSGFLLKSGLSKKVLVSLFLLYSLVGCAHVLIAFNFFPNHGDIWEMFNYSVRLKQQMLFDYPGFVKEFFPDRFSIDFVGAHMGWSNYQMQGMVLMQVFFNFFSFDNIYINTLLFCFLALYGKVAFYRMLCERYPGQYFITFLIVFLIPSVVFWTAVIHKEGVLFSCLGILLYCLQKLLIKPNGFVKSLTVVLMLSIIFVTRKVVLATLIPALVIWWAAERTTIKKKSFVLGIFFTFAACFILLGFLNPAWSLLHLLSEKQHEFLQLKGGSGIFIPRLDDNVQSFARAFPAALLNGLFMPLPGVGGKTIYILFSLELLAMWVLIAWLLFKSRPIWEDGFKTGFFLFALTACLIIGYTVPFAGAIIRYRSIFYPFLLLPFLSGLNHDVHTLNARTGKVDITH